MFWKRASVNTFPLEDTCTIAKGGFLVFWKRASVSTFPFEDSRKIGMGGFLVFWKRASVSTFPFEDSREIGKGDAEITKRSTLDVRSKRNSHLKVFQNLSK